MSISQILASPTTLNYWQDTGCEPVKFVFPGYQALFRKEQGLEFVFGEAASDCVELPVDRFRRSLRLQC